MIKVENLKKVFGKTVALDSINLEIEKEETFGLVGPNGAGKTTAIRIVCGILSPTEGRVLIDGVDVSKNPEIKKRIGYLPEEPNLYTNLTAIELLKYFANLYENFDEKRILSLLKLVGLYNRRNSKIESFSKGMRQRLAIARSIVHDPDIVIFDEPTMGLDPATSRRVREFIKTLKGKTIILCTHYMDEADELCDRIAFLNSGRIAECGTPLELKERFGFKNLYEVVFREEINFEDFKKNLIRREKNRFVFQLEKEELKSFLDDFEKNIFSLKTLKPSLEDVFLRVAKDDL